MIADLQRRAVPLPQFTIEELASLQYWCLKYRALVRAGRVPSSEQDARFRSFSAICIAAGVDSVEP